MEEIAQNFIEAFEVLKAGDPNYVNGITNIVLELCRNPLSIGALLLIFQTNQNDYFRHQAVLTLKTSIKFTWSMRENKAELIEHFLKLVVQESNKLIRYNFIIDIVSTIDEKTLPIAINFSVFALESQDFVQIQSAIWLLDGIVGLYFNCDTLTDFIDNLCSVAISSNDLDLSLDALQLVFDFHQEHNDMTTEATLQFWKYAASLIPKITDPMKFWELSTIIGDVYGNECSYAISSDVFPPMFEYLMKDDLDITIQRAVIYVIDSICVVDPMYVKESGCIQQIFQRYVQLSLANFQPDEEIEIQDVDPFRNICQTFSKDIDFLEDVWKSIQSLLESDSGSCVALLILGYCFKEGVEFFVNYMDDIVNIILNSLSTGSFATREAAANAIDEFITEFEGYNDEYIQILEEEIIKTFNVSYSNSLLTVLTQLFNTSKNTDEIFEKAYPFLMNLLCNSNTGNMLMILPAFTALCRWSTESVKNEFQNILHIMKNIISTTNSNFDIVKHEAVESLSTLAHADPIQFEPVVPEFTEYLISGMKSDDDSLVCSCLNSFGIVLDSNTNAVQQYIEQIIPILYELVKKDKTADLVKLCETNQIDNDDLENDGENIFVNQDSLEIAGGAFLVLSSIIEKFPQILNNCIQDIYYASTILSNSVIIQANTNLCRGLNFIAGAMKAISYNDSEMIQKFIVGLLKIIEQTRSENCICLAIESLSYFIQAVDISLFGETINQIMSLVIDVLECNHPVLYNTGTEEQFLSPDMLSSASFIIFSIIEVVNPEVCLRLFSNIIPIILKYASNEKLCNQTFAIEIIIFYIEKTAESIPQDFLQSVLSLALTISSKANYMGFYCIKKLVSITPDLVLSNLQQILQIIQSTLTSKKKNAKKNLKMLDNCITSLGSIVMNIIGEQFPIQEYASSIFSNMPAQSDLSENPEMFLFFMWILSKYPNMFTAECIGVLARLFARSEEDLKSCLIDDSTLQTLKQILIRFISQTPNSTDICKKALNNNKTKIRLLQQFLSQ